jgi:LmbE family N-acetylglucosaminyl deacetylase
MGAEIAWGILRDGGSVKIVYFTCSGPDQDSEISKVRSREARAAWSLFEFSDVKILELNLPESPVEGPASYEGEAVISAAERICESMSDLPRNSILLVPAAHESHVDHRNARKSAVIAAGMMGRPDIRIVETTEYNDILSMRQNPIKVAVRILREFPLAGRFLRLRATAPGFRLGPPGVIFRDTPERLNMKIRMLRCFESQNPDLLCDYFSWESHYRSYIDTDKMSGFKVMDSTVDLSVMVFISLLSLTSLFFGGLVSSVGWIYESNALFYVVLGMGVMLTTFSIARRRFVLGIFALAFSLGFLGAPS